MVDHDGTMMHAGLARTMFAVALVGLVSIALVFPTPHAHASWQLLVQEEEAETGSEGQEDAPDEGDPSEETGADEGQTQESTTEVGPPWTYQMAKILLVLVVLMGLGIGLIYYRLVVRRRQGRA